MEDHTVEIRDPIIDSDDVILVTGANGFIGSRVLERLIQYGFKNLRCFIHQDSDPEPLERFAEEHSSARLEIFPGDLVTKRDCKKAVRDAALIFHLAAGFGKSFKLVNRDSVVGTRNLLDAVARAGQIKRFLNVSSFTVYSTRKLKKGAVLDESCEIYTRPELKGEAYCVGKVRQEELVREYNVEHAIPYVMVRPGYVYGPGKVEISGRIGIMRGNVFLHLGGANPIPLVYVDNCADAIILAGLVEGIEGQVFNVVDGDMPKSSAFLELFRKNVKPVRSINVPKAVSYLLCACWGTASKLSGGRLPLTYNLHRWSDDWKGHRYSNEKIKKELGWEQRVSFEEGSTRCFDSWKEKDGSGERVEAV
jgi:nucleoside-diphosphate-sugar epimerase